MKRNDLTREWLQNVAKIKVYARPDTSLMFQKHNKHKISRLTPRKDLNGYYYLCFTLEGVRYKILVSRVVWAYYYGECPKDKVIAYKDNNPANYWIDNLELVTRKELFHKKVWDRRK